MDSSKIIGAIVVLAFVGGIAFFFISSETLEPGVIPDYIDGEVRVAYEFAQTVEGMTLLEQIPCYCGCKFEGHLHTRHCFWTDENKFDKHGLTCSVCLDIALKSKEMYDNGADVCEIRYEIDKFYASNAHLGTVTPVPKGCTAYIATGAEPVLPDGCDGSPSGEESCSLT